MYYTKILNGVDWIMNEEIKNVYVDRMVENLTVLRAKLGVT